MHERVPAGETAVAQAARLRRRLLRGTLAANLAGAGVVSFVLGFFFFDEEEVRELVHIDAGLAVFASYLAVSSALAWRWTERQARPLWEWLRSDRDAEEWERDLALRQPTRAALPPAAVWSGAALVLGAVESVEHSPHRGLDVGLTIVLGGLTTCAITYLLAELRMRPAVGRALTANPPERPLTPGVSARLLVVWVLATGVPVLGLVLMGTVSLVLDEYDRDELGAATATLGLVAITAGLLATWLAAQSLAHSLGSLRAALEQVRRGNFEARVAVDDGSEVGLLQAGFNEMAGGLEERERVRDLFGRHVGEEVARAALDRGTELGGEAREIAALFVDLEGSTSFAASQPPEEVVALLNRFFAVVVEVVGGFGGWVNKFEGDAALCVFGAPGAQPDFADRALAAARTMAARLAADVPELGAGIGISAGTAVAGNVGAQARYEYTVIGDPVNEAARLSDLSKERGGVLASERTLLMADDDERSRWQVVSEQVLRGRSEPTGLAIPAC